MRSGGGSGLVARPVFKTAMEGPTGAPVGSIPTRSRHVLLFLAAAMPWLLLPTVGAAQTPPPPPPRKPPVVTVAPPAGDTTGPLFKPVKPLGAFFMSLAVPGWAQARLDRKLTGALFVTVEGLSLAMTMKTIRELKYLNRVGADTARISGKQRQKQDWLILLGFNHLFSGLEGFVASQLHQFPSDVRFELGPAPGGGFAAQARLPFRIR